MEEEFQIKTQQSQGTKARVQAVCFLSTRVLTLLKELFRRFKISSSIPVRVPRSLKCIGPVNPLVLTCL